MVNLINTLMMKNIILLVLAIAVSFISCNPIENRDTLPSLENSERVAEEINLKVENTFPGGNIISLIIDDGYQVHWEAEGINSFKTKDTIRLRTTGEKTIICNVLTKGGKVSIVRSVEVSSVPNLVEEPLAFLIDYFGDGKTWVYATDFSDGTQHWFLSAPYAWDEIWWLPIAEGVSSEDGFQTELFFEKIDDKFFLTVTNFPGDEAKVSEFLFNSEAMTLTVIEDIFPGMDNAYKDTFSVKTLNENELVLFQDGAGAAKNTGWTWRFKRKGFKYLN